MDAGMRAIASMQRDSLSSQRSRPAPAGSGFVFPNHSYAAAAVPTSPPLSPLRHELGAQEQTSAPEAGQSIGLAMTRDSEDEQEAGTQAVPDQPRNSAAIDCPPPLHEPSLDDHPLPSPAFQLPYNLPPHRPESDFIVVLPRPLSTSLQDLDSAPTLHANPPLRFREHMSIIPEYDEKWDGDYDAYPRSPVDVVDEPRRSSRRKKILWGLVVLVIAAAVAVAIVLGVSKATSSSKSGQPTEVNASAESSSASLTSSSTLSPASATGPPSFATPTLVTRSSAILATSPDLSTALPSSTATRSRTSLATTFESTSSSSSSTRRATVTTVITPTTTPSRTTATSTSLTSVLCTISMIGLPGGGATVALPPGMSCPGSRSTRGSFFDRAKDVDEEDENDEDERGRSRRDDRKRHLKSKRVSGALKH